MRIVSDLASQPHATVPQASGDWAATQGADDFWSSPRVSSDAIREAHQKSTLVRLKAHAIVLAIQDTTELNFTHHKSIHNKDEDIKERNEAKVSRSVLNER